jgi:hypothetical protein
VVGFTDMQGSIERATPEPFRPAVIEVLGGLFEGELSSVNRYLASAPRVVLYDEEVVVTAFVQLTPCLVLQVQDDDATVRLELRRLTEDELRATIREEHAWESVIGPNPFGIPIDDAGSVLPSARTTAAARTRGR